MDGCRASCTHIQMHKNYVVSHLAMYANDSSEGKSLSSSELWGSALMRAVLTSTSGWCTWTWREQFTAWKYKKWEQSLLVPLNLCGPTVFHYTYTSVKLSGQERQWTAQYFWFLQWLMLHNCLLWLTTNNKQAYYYMYQEIGKEFSWGTQAEKRKAFSCKELKSIAVTFTFDAVSGWTCMRCFIFRY